MRIVQVNWQDYLGGAGKLTFELHRHLRMLGYDSKIIAGIKTSSDPDVYLVTRRRKWGLVSRFLHTRVENTLSLQYWLRLFPLNWLKQEPLRSADVVNLHNIHGGYFNYLALPRLTSAKVTCWSLHDMWALTGLCTYSYECERWKTGCYRCPLLRAHGEERNLLGVEATAFDLTGFIWQIKKNRYSHSQLCVIVASTWMKKQVEQSILGAYAPVVYIPDGTDVAVFHPVDRALARQLLDIPLDASVVLVYTTPDSPRKGLTYALEALSRLQINKPLWIISVGHEGTLKSLESGAQIREMGYIASGILRNLCYSASDLFLLPTLADNLPLTVLDALASGTPVVAFKVGGLPDAVRPMETGYLARNQDSDDLARGMYLILSDAELQLQMSRRCRELAIENYSLELQARRYAELYGSLIEQRKRKTGRAA